jgi:ABC-type transporter Mla maintaining outer membrane lipid asymmetry ATPase subunit MlaF
MRAIITDPKILLIDEPFSALDYENNLKLRAMIQQYYLANKPTIVLVTHTLPAPWLVKHDVEMIGTWRYNCLGNQYMQSVLEKDTENKIKIWCFGHYHRSVDRIHNGIRYVSNPRGRGDTPWSQPIYYPKRIEIEI